MDERTEARTGHDSATGNAAFVLRLRERGVRDTALLRAMEQVPREAFAPSHLRAHARRDIALPLPCGQTMSAPTLVAAMIAALDMVRGARVLEVGTGSGYASALLLRLGAANLRSIERYATLARAAGGTLGALGLTGLRVETGDGLGQVGEGPYDRILVNGAVVELPEPLCAALAPGGRLVGALAGPDGAARLLTIARAPDGSLTRTSGPRLALSPLTPGQARVL